MGNMNRFFIGSNFLICAAVFILSGCGTLFSAGGGSTKSPPELQATEEGYEQAINAAKTPAEKERYENLLSEYRLFKAKSSVRAKVAPGAPLKSTAMDSNGNIDVARYAGLYIDDFKDGVYALRAASYSATESNSLFKAHSLWSIPMLRSSTAKITMNVEREQQNVDICIFSKEESKCAGGYTIEVGGGGYKVNDSKGKQLCSLTAMPDGSSLSRQRRLYVDPTNNRAYPYTRLNVDAMHGYLHVVLNDTVICSEQVESEDFEGGGYFLLNSPIYNIEFPLGTEPVFLEKSNLEGVIVSNNYSNKEIGGSRYVNHDIFVRDLKKMFDGSTDFESGLFQNLAQKPLIKSVHNMATSKSSWESPEISWEIEGDTLVVTAIESRGCTTTNEKKICAETRAVESAKVSATIGDYHFGVRLKSSDSSKLRQTTSFHEFEPDGKQYILLSLNGDRLPPRMPEFLNVRVMVSRTVKKIKIPLNEFASFSLWKKLEDKLASERKQITAELTDACKQGKGDWDACTELIALLENEAPEVDFDDLRRRPSKYDNKYIKILKGVLVPSGEASGTPYGKLFYKKEGQLREIMKSPTIHAHKYAPDCTIDEFEKTFQTQYEFVFGQVYIHRGEIRMRVFRFGQPLL